MVLTVQRPVVFPQVRFLGKVVDMSVVVQREVPMVQTVRKPVEIPQVSMVWIVQRSVEIAQFQILDKVVGIPVVVQQHVPRSPSRLRSCCSWIGLLTCLFVVRRQVPMVLTVLKTVEVPLSLWQFIGKI